MPWFKKQKPKHRINSIICCKNLFVICEYAIYYTNQNKVLRNTYHWFIFPRWRCYLIFLKHLYLDIVRDRHIFDLKTNQLILKYVIGLHVFTLMPIYFLNKKSHMDTGYWILLCFLTLVTFFIDYIVLRQKPLWQDNLFYKNKDTK